MAALVPELTFLMPAHNAPAADPIRLTELRDALAGVLDGSLVGTMQSENSEMVRYEAGLFSTLVRSDAREQE